MIEELVESIAQESRCESKREEVRHEDPIEVWGLEGECGLWEEAGENSAQRHCVVTRLPQATRNNLVSFQRLQHLLRHHFATRKHVLPLRALPVCEQ